MPTFREFLGDYVGHAGEEEEYLPHTVTSVHLRPGDSHFNVGVILKEEGYWPDITDILSMPAEVALQRALALGIPIGEMYR